MTPERWQRVYALYEQALELPPETRERWFESCSGTEPEAIREVIRLLELGEQAEPLLETSAASMLGLRPQARPVFAPGDLVANRYRVDRLIGRGGMGEVFSAFDGEMNIEVAIKTVQLNGIDDPFAQQRLRQEALLAREVTHRNVCRIHDLVRHSLDGDRGEVVILAMELLNGPTLRDYLATDSRIPDTLAFHIAVQLCAGLDAAHKCGIIHRDLKAANVILVPGADGPRAVITDFGLSRRQAAFSGMEGDRTVGDLFGTPDYLAPEIFSGARAGVPTDIYALGVILFELATGEKPYGIAENLEQLTRRADGPTPSPRQRNPAISSRWDETTRTCLHRDPARRPASAAIVEGLLRGTISLRSSAFTRRRAAVIAGAGLTASLAGLALWQSRTIPIVVFPIENLSGDKGLDYLAGGLWIEMVRQLASIGGYRILRHPEPRRNAPQQLPAQFALAGAVQPDGSIVLNMTDLSKAAVIWTERQPRTGGDLRKVQQQVVLAAVRGLRRVRPLYSAAAVISGQSGEIPPVTTSPQAFQDYFQAIHMLRSRVLEDTLRGIQHLENALRLDAHFGLAYAAMAEAHIGLIEASYHSTAELLLAGHGYADRAVREGPQFPETHLVLASFRQMAWDWDGARASYEEVFRLRPDHGRGQAWYAGMLLQFGTTPEVLERYHRAMDLDPFDQIVRNGYSIGLFFCGNYAEAIRVQEEAIRVRNSQVGRQQTGNVHAYQGWLSSGPERTEHFRIAMEHAAAVEQAERKSARTVQPGMRSSDRMYSLYYALAGDATAAAPYIARLEANMGDGRVSPATIARAYAALGQHDRAMDLIELAVSRRDRVLMYIRTNPFFRVLSANARYQAVLRTMQV
ncbi:protein kinase domain-containing protein [Paludibaculum fermentans]|uniref:protein kinase domain-containing protein n=1 Tax=Paludibaculum fermentans TaxID=1473598 RepID=UPI003EB771DF